MDLMAKEAPPTLDLAADDLHNICNNTLYPQLQQDQQPKGYYTLADNTHNNNNMKKILTTHHNETFLLHPNYNNIIKQAKEDGLPTLTSWADSAAKAFQALSEAGVHTKMWFVFPTADASTTAHNIPLLDTRLATKKILRWTTQIYTYDKPQFRAVHEGREGDGTFNTRTYSPWNKPIVVCLMESSKQLGTPFTQQQHFHNPSAQGHQLEDMLQQLNNINNKVETKTLETSPIRVDISWDLLSTTKTQQLLPRPGMWVTWLMAEFPALQQTLQLWDNITVAPSPHPKLIRVTQLLPTTIAREVIQLLQSHSAWLQKIFAVSFDQKSMDHTYIVRNSKYWQQSHQAEDAEQTLNQFTDRIQKAAGIPPKDICLLPHAGRAMICCLNAEDIKVDHNSAPHVTKEKLWIKEFFRHELMLFDANDSMLRYTPKLSFPTQSHQTRTLRREELQPPTGRAEAIATTSSSTTTEQLLKTAAVFGRIHKYEKLQRDDPYQVAHTKRD